MKRDFLLQLTFQDGSKLSKAAVDAILDEHGRELEQIKRGYSEYPQLKKELESGILAQLGIGEFLKKPVHKLSGGMKKRLSIGCAMAKKPPILLLDEPTAALDLSCKQSIAAYLQHYKQSGGLLLLTTHDVMELNLCDAWYIIRDGVLIPFTYDGNVQKLVESL